MRLSSLCSHRTDVFEIFIKQPGHARGKHARLSNWAPPQEPPGTASLRMSLCRNREPRPQETLQELHAVQEDMMQSTAGKEKESWFALVHNALCNVFTEYTLQILPQSFSSEPSMQSLWKSHLWSRWTHSPLEQENCLAEQGLGICGVTAGLLVPEKKAH